MVRELDDWDDPCAPAARGLGRRRTRGSQTALRARRAPTMKQWSLDARSKGQSGHPCTTNEDKEEATAAVGTPWSPCYKWSMSEQVVLAQRPHLRGRPASPQEEFDSHRKKESEAFPPEHGSNGTPHTASLHARSLSRLTTTFSIAYQISCVEKSLLMFGARS